MKDKTKYGIWGVVLMILFFGMIGLFIKHDIKKVQKIEDRFLRIESRLDSLEVALYPKWEWNPETKKWERD